MIEEKLLEDLVRAHKEVVRLVAAVAEKDVLIDQLNSELEQARGGDTSLRGILRNGLLQATRDELHGINRDNVIASIRVALGNLEKPRHAPEPTPVNYTELVSEIIESIHTRIRFVDEQNIDLLGQDDPVTNALHYAVEQLSLENRDRKEKEHDDKTRSSDAKLVGPHERDKNWEAQ